MVSSLQVDRGPADGTPRPSTLGLALILVAAGLFVLNAGVSRVALRGGIDPAALTTLRVSGAALGFALFASAARRSALVPPRGRRLALVVVHGIVGVAVLQYLLLVAIDRLPIGLALVIQYLAPLLVALWAWAAQGESSNIRTWAGLAVALAGLAAVTELWRGLQADSVGLLAALVCAVCFAIYFILGECGVNSMEPTQVFVWSFATAAVALNVLSPPSGVVAHLGADVELLGRLHSFSVPLWAVLLWMIVLGCLVPCAAELSALRYVKATTVTSMLMLEPAGAVLLGWLWFGESLGGAVLLGCLAVGVGVTLAHRSRNRLRPSWSRDAI